MWSGLAGGAARDARGAVHGAARAPAGLHEPAAGPVGHRNRAAGRERTGECRGGRALQRRAARGAGEGGGRCERGSCRGSAWRRRRRAGGAVPRVAGSARRGRWGGRRRGTGRGGSCGCRCRRGRAAGGGAGAGARGGRTCRGVFDALRGLAAREPRAARCATRARGRGGPTDGDGGHDRGCGPGGVSRRCRGGAGRGGEGARGAVPADARACAGGRGCAHAPASAHTSRPRRRGDCPRRRGDCPRRRWRPRRPSCAAPGCRCRAARGRWPLRDDAAAVPPRAARSRGGARRPAVRRCRAAPRSRCTYSCPRVRAPGTLGTSRRASQP